MIEPMQRMAYDLWSAMRHAVNAEPLCREEVAEMLAFLATGKTRHWRKYLPTAEEAMMPKQYVAMRDKFRKTLPEKAAKTKAAKIFNAKRKPGVKPVTGKSE